MDDGGRALEILRRGLAGGDQPVHAGDQEVGEPGFRPLRGRIEDQRKAVAEEVEDKPGDHLDIAPRVPDADLPMGRRTEAQAQEVADGQAGDALGPIGSEPRRPPARGDQGGDRPVHRRAAGIAPVQIGNDDLKRVERIVIDFPAHPASPDPAAARRPFSRA